MPDVVEATQPVTPGIPVEAPHENKTLLLADAAADAPAVHAAEPQIESGDTAPAQDTANLPSQS